MYTIEITPDQVRAARNLLHWSQSDLAERAGINRSTIADLETGRLDPRASTLRAIVMALKQEGVELTHDGIKKQAAER